MPSPVGKSYIYEPLHKTISVFLHIFCCNLNKDLVNTMQLLIETLIPSLKVDNACSHN